MRISTSVSSCFRNDTNGISCFNPFSRGHIKPVQSRLFHKGVEFDTFKIRIVQTFPNAKIF